MKRPSKKKPAFRFQLVSDMLRLEIHINKRCAQRDVVRQPVQEVDHDDKALSKCIGAVPEVW